MIRRENGEDIQVLKFIRYFNVFNVNDVEDITIETLEEKLKPNERIQKCEDLVSNMPNPPKIKTTSKDRAFYSPAKDEIHIPALKRFETPEHYYVTLFHELIHSTGHSTRLAREEVMNAQMFGSQPYGREELVAELGASILCSELQINYNEIIENSAAYLAGWLEVLKEDPKFIFKVATESIKSAYFIIN